MCRMFKRRWIALAALALTAESLVVCGQTPAAMASSTVSELQFKPTSEQLGDSLMGHQRYQAAIEAYKNTPKDSAEVWNKMGVAYQLLFNTEEAAKCYRMAMKLDPKNAIAANNIGSVFMEQKRYSTAERAYRRALKLDPHSALFHKNLGTALLAEHKYKKGWESYQQALTLDPQVFTRTTNVKVENPAKIQDRGAMNFYMAKGCVKAGMNERAIEFLRMALNEGFTSPKKIVADSEFSGIRDLPAFQQMLAAQEGHGQPLGSTPPQTESAR